MARGLREAGVDVVVGCLASLGPVGVELADEGFQTFACDARGPRDLGALHRLIGALWRLQPDLVHATLTHANVAARLACRWLGIPCLTSTATIEVERRSHRWLERASTWLDGGHIVNSLAVAAHVQRAFGLPADRVHLVPPFVREAPARLPRDEARARLGLSLNEATALWAGRLDPVKRVDLLIRALSTLADLPLKLLIAGDGPQRARLEALAREHAPGRVLFLGWQRDLSPAFSAADFLILPSLTEGMPNVALQAMSLGLPVLASDIPAFRELRGDQRLIRLIPSDAPEAYAAAMRESVLNSAELQRQAERASAWARVRLDSRRAMDELLKIYAAALAKPSSAQ